MEEVEFKMLEIDKIDCKLPGVEADRVECKLPALEMHGMECRLVGMMFKFLSV